MNDLDNLSLYEELDPQDFLGAVERFPDQVRDAIERGRAAEGLPSVEGVDSIAVLGMGGSGISGNVLQAVLGASSKLNIQTIKGYQLPGWVGPRTLVFAASYSGNTEETLETFDLTHRQGARIVIISTGGAIVEKGRNLGLPIVEIPPGLQPRAALGYLAIPMLMVCQRLGLSPDLTGDLEEALGLLEVRTNEYGRGNPLQKNASKQLAQLLFGRVPIIYGSEGLAEVAAYRWKCQLNECAKVPSYHHFFPELNHNEVVGWSQLIDVTREALALVVLRHAGEHPRVTKRIEVTLPLIGDHLGLVHQVVSSGTSALSRLMDLIYLGDFTATYLALLQGVDPTPVTVIENLKKQLAES